MDVTKSHATVKYVLPQMVYIHHCYYDGGKWKINPLSQWYIFQTDVQGIKNMYINLHTHAKLWMAQNTDIIRLDKFKLQPCVLILTQMFTYPIWNVYAVVENSYHCLLPMNRQPLLYLYHTLSIICIMTYIYSLYMVYMN